MNFQIRQIDESDVGTLRTLAQACPPLGLHSAFTYWVVAHFFSEYSFIALNQQNKPVGYVMCITVRDEPDLLYVWQIGVLPEYRQQKVAQELLKTVYETRVRTAGIKRIQVTIDEKNKPSTGLFRSFAQDFGFEYRIVAEASLTDPIDNVTEVENLVEISVA